MKPSYKLLVICLAALLLRLVLLVFVQHPGIADPNHYYNMGARLVEGHGYTINYIWQYNFQPAQVVHPDDYWMPLSAYLAALPMSILGVSVPAGLALFILIGSLLPIVGYLAARQFGCGEESSLFAAAAIAFLPEFVLNSVRTDTTIPNALLVCSTILLLTYGLQTRKAWPFVIAGVTTGLAYLNRSDSALLLPMIVVTALVYALANRRATATATATATKLRWGYLLLVPIIAAVIAAPWLVRNLQYSGSATTPNVDQMFYLTDYRDHYRYRSTLSLQTLLASQTPAQLIGKRLFEIAASAKLMYTTLDTFLPVAVYGGLILVLAARDRQRLLTLAPTLILLGGFLFFYTLLVPFKSQGGSFKKVFLTLIPLLLPLAAYAMERAISNPRLRNGAMALVVVFLGMNAFELVRADATFTKSYLSRIQAMKAVADTLPDTNGDGELVLMTQDPYMLGFVGLQSILFPSDDRNTVLEVAQRYGVDYLLMPPDRPALDAIYLQTDADPRFVRVANVPGTEYVFYGIEPNAI